jgi:quercetin dioxygenase-like cupin family protein
MKDKNKGNLEELMSMVLKLDDLIDYQKGSIVSRQIINKNAGTITVFAFDKGEGLSEHRAPFNALVYIIDGKVKIAISGKQYHLKKGELIIMPANEIHALKAVEKFKMLLVMIRS